MTVEVRFAAIEVTEKYSSTILWSAVLTLLPTYMDKRNIEACIRHIPPEIQEAPLVVAVMAIV